jgi:hypothetical protein
MPEPSEQLPLKLEMPPTGVVTGAKVTFVLVAKDDEEEPEPHIAITFRHLPRADRTLLFGTRSRARLIKARGVGAIERMVDQLAEADRGAFDVAAQEAFRRISWSIAFPRSPRTSPTTWSGRPWTTCTPRTRRASLSSSWTGWGAAPAST